MLSAKRRAAALGIVICLSAGAASCRNVFTTALDAVYVRTDLVMAWLMRPPGPAVTFTSPLNGDTGVALNQSVIVCFNRKVVLPEGAAPFRVQMIDEDGEPIGGDVPVTSALAGSGPGAPSSDTIQVMPPEEEYARNQPYRVSLTDDIFTEEGEAVDPGDFFPLTFTTGTDGDNVPPKVTATVPLDYQSADCHRPVLTVQFDDDVVPATGTLTLYRYDHATQKPADEPVHIGYTAARAGSFNAISFTLDSDLEEYRIYQAVVKGVRDTSGNLMIGNRTGEGTVPDGYVWRFFTGPVVVAVEPASNHKYGFGTFGNPREYINSVVAGYELLDRTAAIIHGRVGEGGQLSTFFDTTNGPEFPDNVSAIRILHNGRNLAGDLSLTPVCKNITGPTMPPPPKGVFYVDPRWGRFLLPRPAYWSKMESAENVTTKAECRLDAAPVMEYQQIDIHGNYFWDDGTVEWLSEDERGHENIGNLPDEGKFGKCYSMYWESDTTELELARSTYVMSKSVIYPFGKQPIKANNAGTISFWVNIGTYLRTEMKYGRESSGYAESRLNIIPFPGIEIIINKIQNIKDVLSRYDCRFGDENIEGIFADWVHVYIVWSEISNSKINMKLIISDSMNITNKIIFDKEFSSSYKNDFIPYLKIYGNTRAEFSGSNFFTRATARSWLRLDNLKWYTHDVSSDPSWEYHSGHGIEEAVHPVYGEKEQYSLAPLGIIEVGYFFIPFKLNN